MVDLALLVLRTVAGSLLLGHGAQKLFGWWGGYGLAGTSGWLESLGLRPGRPWAILAGGSEFGGGVLSLLGLLNPLGPLGIIGSMAMATRKAHWGNPIWVTEGGPELPVTNISIATALLLTGPGRYSLDRALGIRLPRWIALFGLVAIAITVAYGAQEEEPPAQEEESAEQAREELQAEEEDQQQT
jgi:putative oxidoreductase